MSAQAEGSVVRVEKCSAQAEGSVVRDEKCSAQAEGSGVRDEKCSAQAEGSVVRVEKPPRRIESLLIDGPAGKLEALLEEPEDTDPREACLVCHPHPLFGGTMHNKVVYRIARGMRRAGAVVLRFNFRGAGRSEGVHDHGPGEVEDARAALQLLRQRYPDLPYSMAGFSFGSRIALKLGCALGDPVRLVAVGFPTSRGRFDYLAHCAVPKFFVQSTLDEHGPKTDLEAAFEWFAEPKRLEFIEAADHFFAGALDRLEDAVHAIPGTVITRP